MCQRYSQTDYSDIAEIPLAKLVVAGYTPKYMKNVSKLYEFPVIIEKDSDGSFFAVVPSLQGCYTSGKTFVEALENIKNVIALVVEDMKSAHQAIPVRKPVSLMSVEVFA